MYCHHPARSATESCFFRDLTSSYLTSGLSPPIDYLATSTAIPQPSQQDQRMAGTHHDPAARCCGATSHVLLLFLIVIARQGRCLVLRPQIEDGISTLIEVSPKVPKQQIPGTHIWDIGTFNANSEFSDIPRRKRSRSKPSSPRHAKRSPSRGKRINVGRQRRHNDASQALVIPVTVVGADTSASNLHHAAQNLTTPSNLRQSFGQAADSMSGSASSVGLPSITSLVDMSQACEQLCMLPDRSTSANRNALQLDLFAETGGAIHSSADGAFSWSESSTGNQSMITSEQCQYSGSPSIPDPSPKCSHSLVPVSVLRCTTCGVYVPFDEQRSTITHDHTGPPLKNDDPYMTGWMASDINDQGSSLETQFSTNGVPNITIVSPDQRPIESIPPPDMLTMYHRPQMNALSPLWIPDYTHPKELQSSVPGSATSSGSSELFSTPGSTMSYSFPSPDVVNQRFFLAAHIYPPQY
ncbi:hypothetical protein ACEPAI_8253 [Sanghuangporus weigelae]